MIRFPKTLHSIHRWRQGRQLYLFDLEKGLVLPIDQLTWGMLSLCEEHSTSEIARELAPKYPRAEIQESLRKLASLEPLGFLFSDSDITEAEFNQAEGLSIFVPEGLLWGQGGWDFWTNWHHFCLLRTLAHRMSVSIAFPERLRPEMEIVGLGLGAIQKVYFSPGPQESVTGSVPKTCHVIFNLSIQSVVGLKHLCAVKLPVVSLMSSSGAGGSPSKLLHAYLAALREYDAIVIDSPWLKEFFTLPKLQERIFCIPPGIDLDQIRPIEKRFAKETLANAQGNERLLHHPLIGLISGWPPQKATKIGWTLAAANPDLEFVLIDSRLADGFVNQPQNLHTFGVRTLQEKETMPVFLCAFDLCVAQARPGTPAPLLTEAMAYGTPILGIGQVEHSRDGVESANPWRDGVIWEEAETQDLDILIETVSREVGKLLQNPEKLLEQQQRARKVALSLSWESIAQQYADLFQTLKERRHQFRKSYQSSFRHLFVQKPRHGRQGWNWTAVQLPHLLESDPWEALVESLKRCGRTEQEINAVLEYLQKQQEKKSPEE